MTFLGRGQGRLVVFSRNCVKRCHLLPRWHQPLDITGRLTVTEQAVELLEELGVMDEMEAEPEPETTPAKKPKVCSTRQGKGFSSMALFFLPSSPPQAKATASAASASPKPKPKAGGAFFAQKLAEAQAKMAEGPKRKRG